MLAMFIWTASEAAFALMFSVLIPMIPLLILQDDVESGSDSDVEFMSGGALYKMVFVVNGELQMGVGKVAAQVAHACLGLFRKLIDEQIKYAEMLISWEQFG